MLKSMSIHQNDSKGTVKFNFVTTCLAFRGSTQQTPSGPKSKLDTTKKFCFIVTSPPYTIPQ